jgi:hypothetical protein
MKLSELKEQIKELYLQEENNSVEDRVLLFVLLIQRVSFYYII